MPASFNIACQDAPGVPGASGAQGSARDRWHAVGGLAATLARPSIGYASGGRPVRAGRITAAWAEQKAVREIMVFLHSHGVGTARAVRIFKTYGADAVQVMTENPYRLARDIRGIGFKTADAIAMKLGIEKAAMIRVRAGISYALTEAMHEGHSGLPTAELTPLAEKLLDVPQDLIRTALDLELADGTVIADRLGETACVFLAGLYRAERAIAERLLTLTNGRLPWPGIDPDKAIPWIEQRTGLTLAESQKAAVAMALGSKVLVVTGGPGVGKTTIVNAILRILSAKDMSLLLCAPTGRAAKRMNEATGLEAKTIHRLLEVDPKGGGFRRDDANPLDCDLLVVDETSMVDVLLMYALVKAIPDNAALLIVGDVDQLPSVGPGQVLADMIVSGAIPVMRLTEVFRQAAESRIIVNAHRINQGVIPDLRKPEAESDFYFVEAVDPETAVPRIIELVSNRIPRRFGLDPIRDVQVLCPMHRGGVGARSLISSCKQRGDQLMQQLQPLRPYLHVQSGYPRNVAARSVQASDKSNRYRIDRYAEDDRNRRGGRLCREC